MIKSNFRYHITIAVIIGATLLLLVIWSYEERKDIPKVKAVIEETEQPKQTTEATASAVQPEMQSVEVENPIDFDSYWAMNTDIYAYIYIENTNVDYPVLQHPSDNSYYLDYNIDGSKGYPGCIYTEKENAKDFTDSNTIIYGHNMRNGTMFKTLHKFENAQFFEQNKYIYIYLPDQVLQYKIFAAYTYNDRHILNSFDFSNQSVYQSYIDSIFSNPKGNIDTTVPVTVQDRIITLSTCTGNDSTRWLVQAVLLNRFDCAYKTRTTAQLPSGEAVVMNGAKRAD